MPKYSFSCKNCGNKFTVNVSWEKKDAVECPNCGSREKNQDFSLVGFISGTKSNSVCGAQGGTCPTTGFA